MLLGVAFSFISSCSDTSGVSLRNPRDFSWVVDTIRDDRYQVHVNGIDGKDAHNVYACCYSGNTHYKKLFRFDGTSWKEVSLLQFGSSEYIMVFDAVKVFEDGSVAVVGARWYVTGVQVGASPDSALALILRNGVWQRIVLPTGVRSLQAIGGSSIADLWMGGYDGTIFHYDGSTVTPYSLPFVLHRTDFGVELGFSNFVVDRSNDVYVALNSGIRAYLLRFSSGLWSLVDSSRSFQWSLWASPSGRLYAAGDGLDIIANGARTQLLAPSVLPAFLTGTSDYNVLVLTYNGDILHFDGASWSEPLSSLGEGQYPTGIWMTFDAAFAGGFDASQSIVMRGK
jgi:hypothetical protein